jgi:Uma2 family endonuclease
VVPELVIEFQRGSQSKEDLSSRLEGYFKAGVERVWLVDPSHLKIHDHESPSSARTFDRRSSIDGGRILPGFVYPVAELAGDEQAP